MGKQTAKIYYQGKYHSDIITTLGLGTEFQNEYGIFVPANHYKICVKGKVAWERKPANLVVEDYNGICVANDLIHLTSMQLNISSLDNEIHVKPSLLNTFSQNFICSTNNWFLNSKDGFLWEKFYDTEGERLTSDFIKCRCNGEKCIAAYMQNRKILFFNSEFELVKTVTSEVGGTMYPLLGGEKTLYVYGTESESNFYGTMEEYVDGKLTIRHHFTYQNNIGGSSAKLMYNNEEDAIYISGDRGTLKYIHGNIYDVDVSALQNTTGEKSISYPWIPDGDAAIAKVYNFDDSLYSYYEFNNSVLHYRYKSQYDMQGRRTGVTLFKDKNGNMFLTKDLFGKDLTEDKCAIVKGIFSGTPDIISYAYME